MEIYDYLGEVNHTMTAQHKKQAQRRIDARQGKLHLWKLAGILIAGVAILTIAGAMDWSDEAPTVTITVSK